MLSEAASWGLPYLEFGRNMSALCNWQVHGIHFAEDLCHGIAASLFQRV